MRLREVESQVLAQLGVRGDISLADLARLVGVRPHVCRRAVDALFERGLLSRRVVVNPARVGCQIFGLWFSLKPGAVRLRREIVAAIVESPVVSYLGEFEGEFSFKADLYVREFEGVDRFLGELSGRYGDVFSRRSLCCTMSVWDFAMKFLAPGGAASEPLKIGGRPEAAILREGDHDILRLLSSIRNESHTSLARRLGMSAATFDYRVKKLREQGVIVGCHALPEVERMRDFGLLMHVHRIKLTSLGAAARAGMARFASGDEAVYSFTQSIGEWDVEMCTAGRSISAEREFCSRLERACGEALREHTSVSILKHHKVNNYPFGKEERHPEGPRDGGRKPAGG